MGDEVDVGPAAPWPVARAVSGELCSPFCCACAVHHALLLVSGSERFTDPVWSAPVGEPRVEGPAIQRRIQRPHTRHSSRTGTMTTGHGAWCAHCWLTEPRSNPAKPPRPREPTTRRSAPCAISTSRTAAEPLSNRASWSVPSRSAREAVVEHRLRFRDQLRVDVLRERHTPCDRVGERVHDLEVRVTKSRFLGCPRERRISPFRAVHSDNDPRGHCAIFAAHGERLSGVGFAEVRPDRVREQDPTRSRPGRRRRGISRNWRRLVVDGPLVRRDLKHGPGFVEEGAVSEPGDLDPLDLGVQIRPAPAIATSSVEGRRARTPDRLRPRRWLPPRARRRNPARSGRQGVLLAQQDQRRASRGFHVEPGDLDKLHRHSFFLWARALLLPLLNSGVNSRVEPRCPRRERNRERRR